MGTALASGQREQTDRRWAAFCV